MQARAYSLIGDAYMEEENFEQAVDYYRKAASYKPNKYYTPTYLMKEALACEKLNDTAGAKKAYQTIIDQYWESAEFQNARKFIARLNGNQWSVDTPTLQHLRTSTLQHASWPDLLTQVALKRNPG